MPKQGYWKEYYWKNREKRREDYNKWKERNPERYKELQHSYYLQVKKPKLQRARALREMATKTVELQFSCRECQKFDGCLYTCAKAEAWANQDRVPNRFTVLDPTLMDKVILT
jgi:hypothetical protein